MSSELARRIAFTLGALLIFRIGTYVPVPGIDPSALQLMFRARGGGIPGLFDSVSGGGIARFGILALGITSYVTAAVALQLLGFFSRRLRALQSSGERGRYRLRVLTLLLTLALALLQAWGIALALNGINNLVTEPGPLFVASATLTLAGGVMFLVWLSDQITARGIGNGVALLLAAGIILQLPKDIFDTAVMNGQGLVSSGRIVSFIAVTVVLVFVIALIERARRHEPVAFTLGEARGASALSFKLNGAGIVPVLVASWLLSLPLPLAAYFGTGDPVRSRELAAMFDPGRPLYLLLFVLLVLLLTYLYTAMVFDPDEAAEGLKRRGGAIAGVVPGDPTAIHLDGILSRTTFVGAVYLVAICLIPEVLLSRAEVPFFLGGTSLLILVCTVLDVDSQARQLARIS